MLCVRFCCLYNDLFLCGQMLFTVAPGQQLFYYGSRVWPDNVRKQFYNEFGGSPKDLQSVHDYDPKVIVCSRYD